MNTPDTICRISLYLKGDLLIPDELTRRLNIEPTKSHRKGDRWLTSSGKEVLERTGLWAFSAPKAENLSDALFKLSSLLVSSGVPLLHLPGLEEAYIDVFFAVDADEGGGGESEFEIDEKSISFLAKLGVPVRFTVAVVPDDAAGDGVMV